MKRFLILLGCCLTALPAFAWNGAGHRIVALIAWEQLSPPTRQRVSALLAAHPDHPRWLEKAGKHGPAAVFAEASTWADAIRHDERYHDAGRGEATPPIDGRFDSRRQRHWHYVDHTADGRPVDGELDRQIVRLGRLLGKAADDEQTYALPWLIHLVADVHQPLHVGKRDDEGGTRITIENPFNRRQPFVTLHSYWDDLPGPSSLRGRRLQREVQRLLASHRPPAQGDVDLWREESRHLHRIAYPQQAGSLLPIVDEAFRQQAKAAADRRLAEAGYRLGHLLESRLGPVVSRGTGKTE